MKKSPEAFRTISEVSQDIGVPKHVLKFWEGKFAQLRPMKRRGGRRYYRPKDVNLLHGIRHLLYDERYTVKGVQKILQEKGVHFVMESWQPSEQDDTITAQGILEVTTRTANCEARPSKLVTSKLVIGNSLEGCRSVSDVSKALGVPKHVLKFWEGKFTQLRPMKRGGRQLYYRQEDIEFLLGVRQLLYTDKYSIDGVQKILQERGARFVMDYRQPVKQGNAAPSKEIRDVDMSPGVAGLERPVSKPGAHYKQARQKVAA